MIFLARLFDLRGKFYFLSFSRFKSENFFFQGESFIGQYPVKYKKVLEEIDFIKEKVDIPCCFRRNQIKLWNWITLWETTTKSLFMQGSTFAKLSVNFLSSSPSPFPRPFLSSLKCVRGSFHAKHERWNVNQFPVIADVEKLRNCQEIIKCKWYQNPAAGVVSGEGGGLCCIFPRTGFSKTRLRWKYG